MSRLIRVDMGAGEAAFEEPGDYSKFGGRALTSMLVRKEVPPGCHPLGPDNRLVIAPGLLSGTSAANSGRLSIGAKSPLTRGIKESNVGGTAATKLARLGIKAVVVQGKAQEGKFFYLLIDQESAKLLPADQYKGMKNYELVEKLREKHGHKIGVISAGPAGEMKLAAASIAVTDTNGRPSRHAARGGPGAVMGSKGLKAVVLDDLGESKVQYADKDKFKLAAKGLREALSSHPVTKKGGAMAVFGTNSMVSIINASGAFPTKNFSQGQFEGAAKISGEALHELLTKRGGQTTHSACTTCIIQCSNVFVDENKEYVTSGLEYETVWAHGANCGVDDLDTLARIDRLCDDLGLDTMETGCAIAVAMQAGIKEFGDTKAGLELIREIEKGTHLGRVIGNGAAITGEVFGVDRVPVAKRQAMSAYDPRAIKGIGVTYATSTMGADHTAGYAVESNIMGVGGRVDPLKAEGQVELSRRLQIAAAALDSTGLCSFVTFAIRDNKEAFQTLPDMISSLFGWDMTLDDLEDYGRAVLKAERDFNSEAGLTQADDRLPEFMEKEPLPPHNTVFDVKADGLDQVFDF